MTRYHGVNRCARTWTAEIDDEERNVREGVETSQKQMFLRTSVSGARNPRRAESKECASVVERMKEMVGVVGGVVGVALRPSGERR